MTAKVVYLVFVCSIHRCPGHQVLQSKHHSEKDSHVKTINTDTGKPLLKINRKRINRNLKRKNKKRYLLSKDRFSCKKTKVIKL